MTQQLSPQTLFCALALILCPALIVAQSTLPETPQPAPQTTTAPTANAPSQNALPDAPSTIAHELPPAAPTGATVLFDTTMGRLTCKLFDKEAPITTANFVGLATGSKTWTDPVTTKQVEGKPFYDGTTFHRVIPGFMIQGGDRLGSGEGDAGYYIPDEISPSLRFDVPGRLAMANSGPGTDGSQFFITEAANSALDDKYTIFGQCNPHTVLMVKGIALVDRNAQDKPLTPVVLNKITIVPEGQPIPPPPPTAAPPAPTANADSEKLQQRPH
ncbi:MAG: peptidylprolyl isomerase [Acidobacteriota bacterium]|nr:peptidylprolyl isomerase [Acidobacteriota bacterium]